MSIELTAFTFKKSAVRIVERAGEPCFAATDVCSVLELTNRGNAYSRLASDEKTNIRRTAVTMSPGRPLTLVPESGLYKLIVRSDKPEAIAFQEWVTREVLPAIRKTGGYMLAGADSADIRSGENYFW